MKEKELMDIIQHYESYDEQSRFEARWTRIEYLTTMHYIERYIQPRDRILEIGAGTGRYSLELARQGYDVTSVELVPHNLEILRSGITESMCIHTIQGNALNLETLQDEAFDMTLLLGPMYHLFEEADKHRALSEALRVTKRGGIAMGRESLTDPHWPEKAKAGLSNDIRHCIGCLQGCTASTYQGVPLYCALNPELGHEWEYDYTPAKEKKTIYIAGAGVAGMEAARAAAIKGHTVALFEMGETVGGQFVSAAYPPYKGDDTAYTAWLYREIQKYPNITLHLNTELTPGMIREAKPHKVIIATGGLPFLSDIPGVDLPKVLTSEEALLSRKPVGNTVVVAGGGLIGAETAAFFGTQCKDKVILLAKHEDIAQKTDVGIRDDLKSVLSRLFVDIHYCTRLVGVTEVGAVVQHQNDEPVEIPCDSVVIAAGTRSRTLLAQQVADLGVDVVVVGDAVKPRQITQASAEGFRAGLFA